jgi:nitrogen regulatory protein PII
MREIKAFIRVNVVGGVIQALEAAGITNITVIDVRSVWAGHERAPQEVHYSLELAERYMNVARLETLVPDEDVERVIELIRKAAHTGRPGDGVIYAVPVEGVVHVRTGRRGRDATRSGNAPPPAAV